MNSSTTADTKNVELRILKKSAFITEYTEKRIFRVRDKNKD
jgi:hypothetical protein